MEIKMLRTFKNSMRFCLKTSPVSLCTSKEISLFFGMDVFEYNKKLLDEVIKHKKIFVNATIYENTFSNDLTFKLNKVCEEVYIKRFKEVFAPQLMLAIMEGKINEWFKDWNLE